MGTITLGDLQISKVEPFLPHLLAIDYNRREFNLPTDESSVVP